jgi:hypothetical protein
MTASLTKVAIFSLSEKLDLRMVGTAFANLGIWPGEAEGFSGFLLERQKRREIQAKLESLVEDMRQEQREVVDPKMLMGDRGEG